MQVYINSIRLKKRMFDSISWNPYDERVHSASLSLRFFCYLLTVAVMPTTKTLLLKIFVNIILIRMQLLALHGISLNVSGHWIYLTLTCLCEHPCSDSKYGRTVHLAMKDNPRLINIPPRDSEDWKTEFNARTSAERSNKREKLDFKLEDGRHRSTKMWYCRLYHIMMLQHLDAWDLPYESALRKLILQTA